LGVIWDIFQALCHICCPVAIQREKIARAIDDIDINAACKGFPVVTALKSEKVIFAVLVLLFQKTFHGIDSGRVLSAGVTAECNSRSAVPPVEPAPPLSYGGHVMSSGDVIGCRTPASGHKRSHRPHFVASPEPSPPEGGYVGQHSQGIGGHYAESYLAKRRRKL